MVLENWIDKKYGNEQLLYFKHTPKEKINHHGVYILFKDNRAVYVGKSKSPYQRINNHGTENKKDFDAFRVLKGREDRVDYWESYLIYKLQPKYNNHGTKHKHYKRKFLKVSDPFSKSGVYWTSQLLKDLEESDQIKKRERLKDRIKIRNCTGGFHL